MILSVSCGHWGLPSVQSRFCKLADTGVAFFGAVVLSVLQICHGGDGRKKKRREPSMATDGGKENKIRQKLFVRRQYNESEGRQNTPWAVTEHPKQGVTALLWMSLL